MAANLQINWSFVLNIDGGPQLSEAKPVIEVLAYDYITAPLAPGVLDTPSKAEVNPPSVTGTQTIVILATKYSDKVGYKDAAAEDAPLHVLDGPHIFIGRGAVAFLGDTTPNKLQFFNKSNEDITVQVFVGRPAA